MPLTLLAAIFLAFGLDFGPELGPLGSPDYLRRALETLAGVALVGAYAAGLGYWVVLRVDRDGGPSPALRRNFGRGSRLLDLMMLGSYAWILHGVGWPAVVRRGLGLGGTILVDEFLILLPFLAAQFLGWLGLYRAERALRSDLRRLGLGRYLVRKARQAMGLVLPIALIFSLGQDVLARWWPDSAEDANVQLAWVAAMGTLVLVLAPAFVRLAWPTRSLPDGPLRDRLERLSRRFGFRCTDILIWDTNRSLVNAGVTGALPWFRYVLLTDALIENLDARQVEAVFGHEIGHIAHRHLNYFGLFIVGSIGLLALVEEEIGRFSDALALTPTWPWTSLFDDPALILGLQWALLLTFFGLYFLLVFGYLSRRFERQADVFGCRAVSCGRPNCPPHADLNAHPAAEAESSDLCPVGIRIFAGALSEVADLNGMERESWWAWRHGSIARRIAFLEALEGRPEAERRFQRTVLRLRVGLALTLAGIACAAIYTNALGGLR